MRATTDTLDVVELILKSTDTRVVSPVLLKKTVPVPAVRRAVREKWSSSLDRRDLECLLAVLETHLIPRMIQDYAPASTAPLNA